MAQQIELEVAPREVMGKATKHLRQAGLIPGNIFGHKQPSQAIQLDLVSFQRLQREHGTRNIVHLRLPNARSETALIRRIQHDPRTGKILHVDFSRVDLAESVEVKVPLRFVGEAPGVKNEGGVLLHLLEALTVECRASDIVEAIEVDIAPLTEIDSALYARDIKLPPNHKLVTDPDEPVVKVAAPRVEVAEEAAKAEGEAVEAPASGSEG